MKCMVSKYSKRSLLFTRVTVEFIVVAKMSVDAEKPVHGYG